MKHGIASDEMIDILVRGPQEAHASFAGARRFSAGAWILLCSSAYLLECVSVFVCVCAHACMNGTNVFIIVRRPWSTLGKCTARNPFLQLVSQTDHGLHGASTKEYKNALWL